MIPDLAKNQYFGKFSSLLDLVNFKDKKVKIAKRENPDKDGNKMVSDQWKSSAQRKAEYAQLRIVRGSTIRTCFVNLRYSVKIDISV